MHVLAAVISRKTRIPDTKVSAALDLLAEGFSPSYISRYKKFATGQLTESQVSRISFLSREYEALLSRKNHIKEVLKEANVLNEALEKELDTSWDFFGVEDLFLPYRVKRRNKASKAVFQGVEPFADMILKQEVELEGKAFSGGVEGEAKVKEIAETFINAEKELLTIDAVMKAARAIVIEKLCDFPEIRKVVRDLTFDKGKIKVTKGEGKGFDPQKAARFEVYFNFRDSIKSFEAPKFSYRYLAIRRGKQDKALNVEFETPDTEILEKLRSIVIKNPKSVFLGILEESLTHVYTNRIRQIIETEIRTHLKSIADEEAIARYCQSWRRNLLKSPFGEKRVIAIEPAYRTGCRLVAVSEKGECLDDRIIFPIKNEAEAKTSFLELVEKYQLEGICISNGNASLGVINFIKSLLREKNLTLPIEVVNKSGITQLIHSAVEEGKLPDEPKEVALELARRFQNPLRALLRIDPRNFSLGQFQTEVNSSLLLERLNAVSSFCVNSVGVDVNSAPVEELRWVSGLGPELAEKIVEFRKTNGSFKSKSDLLKVEGLTDSVFEKMAGFIRVDGATAPLDRLKIHPDHYQLVEKIAESLGKTVEGLFGNKDELRKVQLKDWVSDEIDKSLVLEILKELEFSGKDQRKTYHSPFQLGEKKGLSDLKQGDDADGIVTNVTRFGVFVDIGIDQDGLVHLSEMTNRFIYDPQAVVGVGDHVRVRVISLDPAKKQFNLSFRPFLPEREAPKRKPLPKREERRPSPLPAKKTEQRSQRPPSGERRQKPKGAPPSKAPSKGGNKSPFNNPFAEALKGFHSKGGGHHS